ncbi:MAG: efflux RND transporter periplasmic adaptor subunit [Bacteroidetes bacterium]|nr:efflux RND transporter periplasmic adaptor subunit [Bacteroidota bacterium]MCL5739223.1 efflux RND transporter periplasmic adaptor subunit [Bacteroidota bacterium]
MPNKHRGKKKKWIIGASAVVLLAIGAFVVAKSKNNGSSEGTPSVKVARGTIQEKALAVGTIEPQNEISIKSRVSGVVKRLYVDVGSFVHAGDPLLEVKPDPTPIELADAKRQLELALVDYDNVKREKDRQDILHKRSLISDQDYDNTQKQYKESELRVKIAREKLELMQSGKVTIGNTKIESIIYAPIDGYVLTRTVEVGDPVTPLTSYQEGTVLMKMANMKNLVFKGTVDEIDVGKLREGMPAELRVGALPGDTIPGRLSKIWLEAEKKENASVFPIEIAISNTKNVTLRAGYSANADVIIQKKTNILYIPERVVTFRNDSSFVKLALADNKSEERAIKTGLSDAINIEVVSGLKEGDKVLEKPVTKIN